MQTKITTHEDALNMIGALDQYDAFTVDYSHPTRVTVTHSNGVVVLRATWNMSQPMQQPVTVKHHSKLFTNA